MTDAVAGWRLCAAIALVGTVMLAADGVAQSLFEPSDAAGASELTVRSHGQRMRAVLHHWDWCSEGSAYCQAGTIDYVYDPDPPRLPLHAGAAIRLRTGRPARAVTLSFERRADGWRELKAEPSGGSGTRWTARAPGHLKREQEIGIEADYRYDKDARTYGGRYFFSLPVRKHRHG